MYGEKNLKLWMDKINFNNFKHLSKYLIWKQYGFCPPKTNLKQREEILSEKLDPYSFYKNGLGGI